MVKKKTSRGICIGRVLGIDEVVYSEYPVRAVLTSSTLVCVLFCMT